MFDAIATVIDTMAKPLTAEDDRTPAERHADALAEVRAYALTHASSAVVPESGGFRPHLNVITRLEDLENRCRSTVPDFGGAVTPAELRALACDAAAVPIVMDSRGQVLDIGRLTRTIPDRLRRAVAARDLGCAHPGCDRPGSWCEIHHITPWAQGGDMKIDNLVMLCKVHHRLLHADSGSSGSATGSPDSSHPRGSTPPGTHDESRYPTCSSRGSALPSPVDDLHRSADQLRAAALVCRS
jgi:5-methylcytosine-specific restriction protein A